MKQKMPTTRVMNIEHIPSSFTVSSAHHAKGNYLEFYPFFPAKILSLVCQKHLRPSAKFLEFPFEMTPFCPRIFPSRVFCALAGEAFSPDGIGLPAANPARLLVALLAQQSAFSPNSLVPANFPAAALTTTFPPKIFFPTCKKTLAPLRKIP
jgi:hypothetical protein